MQQEKTDLRKEKREMNYQEVTDYVESLQVYGSVPGLDNIIHLCEELGNPQEKLSFVHIAGTNGKGSVLAFVSTILKEAGYRTGRYLSPTIFEYRERFQIGGKVISKKDLCRLMGGVKDACDRLVEKGKSHPTVFEVETALAFLYFAEKECDIVVLETGLGGREDATNLIKNTLVAAFASISMDHMAILGDTLTKIASQKAGIIKKDCLAVTVRQKQEVMQVLSDECKEKEVLLCVAEPEKVSGVKSTLEKQRFSYGEYKNLEISLAGRYQIDNAVTAVEVIRALDKKGYPVSEKALRAGLLRTTWPGRFQILCKKPIFIADGAHNRDAAKRLAETIRFYFTNRRIIYIMGMLRDKEQEEVIRQTYSFAEQILTVPTKGARGTSSYELAMEIQKYHSNVTSLDSVEEAVELSFLMADKDTVIISFGSLSYLGRLIEVVENRDKIRSDLHGK